MKRGGNTSMGRLGMYILKTHLELAYISYEHVFFIFIRTVNIYCCAIFSIVMVHFFPSGGFLFSILVLHCCELVYSDTFN